MKFDHSVCASSLSVARQGFGEVSAVAIGQGLDLGLGMFIRMAGTHGIGYGIDLSIFSKPSQGLPGAKRRVDGVDRPVGRSGRYSIRIPVPLIH